MKKLLALLLCAVTLAACSSGSATKASSATSASTEEIDYTGLFNHVELILNLQADLCNTICSVTNSVWYEAIHEKKYGTYKEFVAPGGTPVDFNTAINNFQKSEDYLDAAELLKENAEELKQNMKTLKDCPEEYEDAFEYLLEAYTMCNALQDAALNPSGKYTDYSANYNRLLEEFNKAIQKVEIYKP